MEALVVNYRELFLKQRRFLVYCAETVATDMALRLSEISGLLWVCHFFMFQTIVPPTHH